jgi:O-antigen ligase
VELIRESIAYKLLKRILYYLRQGYLNELCGRFSVWIKRIWKNSCTARVLSRQGALAAGWDKSLTFRLTTWLFNIVPCLLQKIYEPIKGCLNGSLIMRAIWYCGENAHIALSWFFLALLVVPQEYWNNAYSLAAMLLIFAVYYVSLMKHKSSRIELKSTGVYAAAFAAFVLLFFVISTDRAASVRFFSFHLTCMLAVLLIVNSVGSGKELMRIVDFSMAGLLVSSVYAIGQRISGIEVNKIYVDLSVNANMPGRVFSFFQNPNSYAMLLVLLTPLAGALALYGKGKKRLFYAAVFAVSVVALTMTYSRGAWAGFALGVFVFFLIMRPILAPVFLVAAIFALPLLPDAIFNRIMTSFNTKDTSISSRKPVYRAVWRLIAQNPFFGSGLGSDTIKSAIKRFDLYHSTTPYIHAHSFYLEIWAETGVFGLLALLGTIASGMKKGLLTIFGKRGSRELQAVIAACIAAFTGILLCSIMDYPWSFPRVMVVFWYVFALLTASVKLAGDNA